MGTGVAISRVDAGESNQGRLNTGETCEREVWPGWMVRW